MGRAVTAKDLNLDDEDVFAGSTQRSKKAPEQDSAEFDLVGGPEDGQIIGKEVVDKQVAEAKARQKKAEEDRIDEEMRKLEGEPEPKKKAKPKESDSEDEPGEEEEEEEFQYKDQAAAEKAVRDAKRKLHELATEKKKLEKVASDLEQRVQSANANAPQNLPPGQNQYEEKRKGILKEAKIAAKAVKCPTAPSADEPEYDEKWKQYVTDMDAYNDQVSEIWGKAQTEIAETVADEKEQARADRKAVIDAIAKAMMKAGLVDENGEVLGDIEKLFWTYADALPIGLSVEDRIKQAVEKCKAFVDSIRGKEQKRTRDEKKTQEDLEVMGRGAKITPKKSEPEPLKTTSEIQRAVMNRRKLRYSPG